jgi:hypothetical protein
MGERADLGGAAMGHPLDGGGEHHVGEQHGAPRRKHRPYRRLAVAQRVAVDQVVVHQRGRMDHLDRQRRGQRRLHAGPERLSHEAREAGAQALAAGEDRA